MYVFLCLKEYLLIYSAASDLGCSLWDLWCSLQRASSSLWHMGSDSLTRDWTRAPCIECGVWASGPPGKSLYVLLVSALCPLPLSLSRLHLHLCSPNFHQQSHRLAQVCMVSRSYRFSWYKCTDKTGNGLLGVGVEQKEYTHRQKGY